MIEITFEQENNRVAAYDGEKRIGSCQFEVDGKNWIVSHTEVDPEYGGQGIAKRLVEAVSDEAQKAHVHLSSICPYAAKILGR